MFEQHYNLILAKILFFSHIRTKRKLKLLAHLLIVLVAPLCVHMGYQVCQTQKKDQSREHRKWLKLCPGGLTLPCLLCWEGGQNTVPVSVCPPPCLPQPNTTLLPPILHTSRPHPLPALPCPLKHEGRRLAPRRVSEVTCQPSVPLSRRGLKCFLSGHGMTQLPVRLGMR